VDRTGRRAAIRRLLSVRPEAKKRRVIINGNERYNRGAPCRVQRRPLSSHANSRTNRRPLRECRRTRSDVLAKSTDATVTQPETRANIYGKSLRVVLAPCSRRCRSDEDAGAKVRASFPASDRTYGAKRMWHYPLADGVSCGLHRIERLRRLQALSAFAAAPAADPDERQAAAVATNVLDRSFEAAAPNRK
jgi:hypothetical protein